jgi:hypothetical protein
LLQMPASVMREAVEATAAVPVEGAAAMKEATKAADSKVAAAAAVEVALEAVVADAGETTSIHDFHSQHTEILHVSFQRIHSCFLQGRMAWTLPQGSETHPCRRNYMFDRHSTTSRGDTPDILHRLWLSLYVHLAVLLH